MPIYLSSQFDLRAQLPIRKYMTVANTSQRDAIPAINRYEGFETYVTGEEKVYRLQGGITNAYWVEQTSSSTDKYLSAVTVNSIVDVDFVIANGTDIEGVDFSHTHAWSEITSTPTTEGGYGITDGFTSWDKDYNDLINKPTLITAHNDLTGRSDSQSHPASAISYDDGSDTLSNVQTELTNLIKNKLNNFTYFV